MVPKAPAVVISMEEMYFCECVVVDAMGDFTWIMNALISPLMGKSIPAEQAKATKIFCPTINPAVSAEEVDPMALKANGRYTSAAM